MITKSEVKSNLFSLSASNILVACDTQRTTNSTSYQLLKSFKIAGQIVAGSTIRVTYDFNTSNALYTATTRLLLNTTQLALETNQTTDMETVTSDITTHFFNKGDMIYLYGKISNASGLCRIENFRIYAVLSPAIIDTDTSV